MTGELAAARSANPPVNPPANPPTNPQNDPPTNPDLETALNRIQELERENRRKDIAAYATEKGLSGEQANNVLNAFGDDVEAARNSIDAICQIISDRETAAATAKEQEIAQNASNPGGGSGGGGGVEQSNAEKLATKFFGGRKQEDNILSHYVGGN